INRALGLVEDAIALCAAAADETPSQQFIRYFRESVLTSIHGPIAIFLEEIDSTLKFAFTDDLFTALRSIYNERPLHHAYRRLTFCLVGVATPNELIKDPRTTPYNVGETLWVDDFKLGRDDLSPLRVALHDNPIVADSLLRGVMYWTDGHPYLTLRLCRDLR